MSTLSAENNSDLETPTHETPILDVEIPNSHQESQESAIASSSVSSKKQTSIYYKYFTLTDKRWHCNYCRYGFAILLFKNNVVK